MKTSLGILVTAAVLFVFGFLYWAANPLRAMEVVGLFGQNRT